MSKPIITAPSLVRDGLVHGFTTRQGGVSGGSFASFNLSTLVDDDPRAVAQNRERFSQYTGLSFDRVVGLNQVHGTESLLVDRHLQQLGPVGLRSFDASLTDRSDVVLAVRTADCVPILFYCEAPRAVAAIHAGWRGTLEGIAGRTAEHMEKAYGCQPENLWAVIGPCISVEHFQVGEEVFAPFAELFDHQVAVREADEMRVDLVLANRRVLESAGLVPDHIESLDMCTFEQDDLFFSHRRDEGVTGRQLAFIALAD